MSAGRRPDGFTVLAACAALFSLCAGVALAGAGGDVVGSAMLAAWGSAGLPAAEAPWGVRRWAFVACMALAASVLAPFVIIAAGAAVTGDVGFAPFILLVGGLVAVGVHPVLEYVHDHSRALHPRCG
jgi:hypothetical protein